MGLAKRAVLSGKNTTALLSISVRSPKISQLLVAVGLHLWCDKFIKNRVGTTDSNCGELHDLAGSQHLAFQHLCVYQDSPLLRLCLASLSLWSRDVDIDEGNGC